MKYKRLVLGALGTNCYVLWDEKGEGVVIDPADNAEVIMEFLGQNNITLRWVWLTHAHFDHMLAASDLLRQTGAQLAVHTKDAAALCDPDRNLSAWDPAFRLEPLKADRLLYEGDRLQVGEMCLTVLHTPGHTEGTMSFFFDVTDGEKTYRAGMFGGAGTNTLKKAFLTENNLSFDCRQKMMDSIQKVKQEKVELFLGNHLDNNRTEEKLEALPGAEINPFLENSQQEWESFLEKRLKAVRKVIAENL